MNTDYKSNSHKSKENTTDSKPAGQKKVISGTATRKKKSEMSKIAGSVIAEDAANVGNYIMQDVLIPSLKKAISDIVTNGIDMLLYGETGVTKRRESGSSSRVSYRSYYDKREPGNSGAYKRSNSYYDFDEVVVDSYAEADRILSRMDEQIVDCGSVCVGDMYDYAGLPMNWTDNKYGWTDIRDARPERTRDGKYVIRMPKAKPI